MPQTRFFKKLLLLTLLITGITFTGCSSDDDPTIIASITVNGTELIENGDDFNGDTNGDFTGTGGSTTRTFLWDNNLNTADYNADITATTNGVFRMVVNDADSNVVLDRSLNGEVEPDSFSGVTDSGTPGLWSVTITLTNFDGDGSFSLSEGD